jgi:hypothetical protein
MKTEKASENNRKVSDLYEFSNDSAGCLAGRTTSCNKDICKISVRIYETWCGSGSADPCL